MEVLPAVGGVRCAPTQRITGEELPVGGWDSSCSIILLFCAGVNSHIMGQQQNQSAALIIKSNGNAGAGRRILKISLAPQW